MQFMSAEHVAAMNTLLHEAQTVRSACAQLNRMRVISYTLTDGPDSAVVHWTITFADTVQFSLKEALSPDVRVVGDWARMIEAARAGREGQQKDSGVSIDGDESVLAEVNTALETASAVATLPVEFPPPERTAEIAIR